MRQFHNGITHQKLKFKFQEIVGQKSIMKLATIQMPVEGQSEHNYDRRRVLKCDETRGKASVMNYSNPSMKIIINACPH